MNIIKRDGRKVLYNENKITTAILKTFNEVDGKITNESEYLAKKISSEITNQLSADTSVEEIQDLVERKLMASKRKDVARAYIIYRKDRSRIREQKSSLMRNVSEKLAASSVENQNANIDEHAFSGRIGQASDAVLKEYALNNCMSEMSRNNHLNNEIYIHDLNSYAVGMHNCLSVPFDDLLANGVKTRQTDIRPPQSISTAMQLVAVIFQLQSLEQFGGVSATHLDWTMVPYVRKSYYKHFRDGLKYMDNTSQYNLFCEHYCDLMDKHDVKIGSDEWGIEGFCPADTVKTYAIDLTEKETYQAVEAMYHNLNTLQSRSGGQLPFSSINYGTCTLPEGRMVTRALLQVSIDGLGSKHRTSIFPCGIFQCMNGVNRHPGDPNYDLFQLALQSTAQRLYPNYANVDWTGNAGYDRNDPRTYFSTMGCRTANGWDINGFGQLKDGRGNICPVTIILPTLAMESGQSEILTVFQDSENSKSVNTCVNGISKSLITQLDFSQQQDLEFSQNIANFMELLDRKIHEAKDMLIERFNWIASQSPESAKFMYENHTMAGYVHEDGIVSALKHGTLAIGQIGLAETLQLLVGCDQTDPKGMELAKQIEQLFKDRCAEFKQEYKLNFGVYYTPAENLCYTAMKKFKDKYGIIPNVSDKEFFTNSIHVPVWKNMSPFEKIDIESQLTGYSSAGCITYVELDSGVKNNLEALETIVNYAMDHDIPYFAVNVPNDMCNDCGYTDEINDECPMCGGTDIRRLRRVTGYLTGDYKTAFNKGKQQEVEMRVKHGSSNKKKLPSRQQVL